MARTTAKTPPSREAPGIISNSSGYLSLNTFTDNDSDDPLYHDPSDMFGRRGVDRFPEVGLSQDNPS